ncbi:hypothetical protein BDZ97DRAFT_1915593 [Flammula alnicola]|nr:hypothetical protein BDZ97DRAFT_1915593 [Flammula alnicola]
MSSSTLAIQLSPGHRRTEEMHAVLSWMSQQPHPHKIFIAGNHDADFVESLKDLYPQLPIYLQETSISLKIQDRQLMFYGSPFTPRQGSWPFQYPRITPAESEHNNRRWSSIPDNVDVLITHGPPRHHVDLHCNCFGLLVALWRVRPKLHVFGNIHAARGTEVVAWTKDQKAYERIVSGISGWWDLPLIFYGWLLRIRHSWTGRLTSEPLRLLVNAAAEVLALLRWRSDQLRKASLILTSCLFSFTGRLHRLVALALFLRMPT